MHDKDCLRCEKDLILYGHTAYDYITNEHHDVITMVQKNGLTDKPLNMFQMLSLWKSVDSQRQKLSVKIESAAANLIKPELVEIDEATMTCLFKVSTFTMRFSFEELERNA